jgi:hypothetical protein
MGVRCINHHNANAQILGTVLNNSTRSNLQLCAARIQVASSDGFQLLQQMPVEEAFGAACGCGGL